MKKYPLITYLVILTVLSLGIVLTIYALGEQALYFAQFYMLTPAIAGILTRLFFYENKFADSFIKLVKSKYFFRFWAYSLVIAALSYVVFTLFGSISWDFTGQSFLDKIALQFQQSGQNIEDSLPDGFTPEMMLWLFFVGNLTVFNILPGLITGFGEEFGHRGVMFHLLAKRNIYLAVILGGLIWFAWHLPLQLIIPTKVEFSTNEMVINYFAMAIGSICTHCYLSYVFVKTKCIWVAALAHITINNVSAAFAFFVIIENQTLANLGLVTTMILVVAIGFATGEFQKTFKQLKETNENELVLGH